MEPIILIDLGSTYTKVTAVDADRQVLLGTAAAYTTVAEDISIGLGQALARLEKTIGQLGKAQRYACSSAAGGLRMIVSGLVPALTAEAARLACLGAGAKVVKVYAYELTQGDLAEIQALAPDIFLLTGGTDGGNTACIRHNAAMLAQAGGSFPILLAGNRACADECARLLDGREIYCCENVLPAMDRLNIEPVQARIREVFLARIIKAKGLDQIQRQIAGSMMPTPAAVLRAMTLLAQGTEQQPGIGDLVAVDLGGATTDVYSLAAGLPQKAEAMMKGLPEPYAKRTVEGDIGMRYSAGGILAAAGSQRIAAWAGSEPQAVADWVAKVTARPDLLAATPAEEALDDGLAAAAVAHAMARHAGHLEPVYTPMGAAFIQTGKDLTAVENLVLTGGALIRRPQAACLGRQGLYDEGEPYSLRPKKVAVYVDRSYILSAMGLLAEEYPDCALALMRKELEYHGADE